MMKNLINKRFIFDIKTPKHKGRSSFAITKVEKHDTKIISRKVVKDDRIYALNTAFKNEFKSFDECLEEIRQIKQEYANLEEKKKPKIDYNSRNLELVRKYFNKIYRKKKIKDTSKRSMLKDLERSVKSLGRLSLFSASEDEIQEQIDDQFEGDKQRRIVARLRQLLKFIGRVDVQLFLDERDEKDVKYLEPHELDLLLDYIKDDRILHCLVTIAARGGLRQSEIYGIRKHCLKNNRNLFVDSQLLQDGVRRLPKNKKKRTAFLMDGVSPAIEEWLLISDIEREAYRAGATRIPKNVKKACRDLFPDNPSKHLNFHDLRHCYAIYLVSIGIPTDLISKFMGNSPEVCRMYYQGFMISNTGLELAISIFEKSKTS